YYVGMLFLGASGAITNTQVTPPSPPAPITTKTATTAAILVDSTYTTDATYNVGDNIQVSTIVPAGTDPVSIQGFRDGTPGNVLSWNVAETGYDYIIGGGP